MERNEKSGQASLLKGAATIAVGGLVAKLIGAVYRIPLTNLIGGEGIGLYQLVYPFYCLLLTVSATGIPSSIATLTARKCAAGENPRPLFRTCMRLFLTVGGALTVFMVVIASFLAKMQGEVRLTGGYYALAPSVFLVSAISVFRGYFQGQNKMSPTALSEIIEQAVKVGVGLCVAYYFREDVYMAVTALLLAVTISEGVALAFLWARFRCVPAPMKTKNNGGRVGVTEILRLSIPVTLSACFIPLFGMVDSVLIVRLLNAYEENAVALYGLFSGGAVTIINLPVSVCYGLAAASVPNLSAARKNGASGRKNLVYALGVTFLISLLSAIGIYCFADIAVGVLFRSLSEIERQTLVRLVKLFAVSTVTLSCVQTLSACLTALGKPTRAAVAMFLAMLVKTALNVVLLQKPEFGIYGAALAASGGYAVAFALDIIFAFRATRRKIPLRS